MSDITEQKKTENALYQSELRYRTLFENMMDSFALHEMIFDDNGLPVDYRFLEVNSAFEDMTGFKRSDIGPDHRAERAALSSRCRRCPG